MGGKLPSRDPMDNLSVAIRRKERDLNDEEAKDFAAEVVNTLAIKVRQGEWPASVKRRRDGSVTVTVFGWRRDGDGEEG